MNVDQVIEEFIEADKTLRELITLLDDVRTSRTRLDEAQSELGEARAQAMEYLESARRAIAESVDDMDSRTLSQVHRTVESVEAALLNSSELSERRLGAAIDSLTDASRRLQEVAVPLKEQAQQLVEVASSWRTVRPEELHDGIAELQAAGRRQRTLLVGLMAIGILNLVGVFVAIVT